MTIRRKMAATASRRSTARLPVAPATRGRGANQPQPNGGGTIGGKNDGKNDGRNPNIQIHPNGLPSVEGGRKDPVLPVNRLPSTTTGPVRPNPVVLAPGGGSGINKASAGVELPKRTVAK